MNRVYKVTWSKAKHCYVVTSEIARSVTKSASSARSAGRKGAAVLAMAALLFTAGGMLGEAANVTDVTAGETANVITVTKEGSSPASITINNVAHAKEADSATEATKAYSDGDGLVIKNTYVKIADAKVGDEVTYVNAANTVGQNLSALDTNLSALDTQVKANADAVAAEATARKAADQNNLKVGDDGVISKVTGDDGTTSSPVNKLVLNKDGDNQITMDEKGIKVGTNSTVIASDGVFAGGDTADAAKAALNADGSIKGADGKFAVGTDGSIKGANGKFEVNADGKVTAKGGVNTAGDEINTAGGKITAGAITGTQLNTQGGDIIGGKATVTELTTQGGDISGGDITATGLNTQGGEINGGDIKSSGTIHADGKITGNGLDAGSGAINGGSLSVTGAIEGNSLKLNGGNLDAGGGTITTTGKITTKDLEVTGGLTTDHITLGSETNNYTDIKKGNVTSKVNEIDGAVKYTAESFFNRDGSSITARTDEGAVDSTGISKVGATEISQYLGDNAKPESSQKNVTRKMVRNDDGTFRLEDKVVDKDGNKSSIVSQNAGERKVVVDDGTKTLTVTENLTGGIVSETNGGKGGKVTLTQGMDGTYKVETSGTSTEDIGGQKIENYKGGLKTEITGNETHHVTQNQTITVDGTLTETVKGDVTEKYEKNLTTTVTGDSSLSANNITNKATEKLSNSATDIENKASKSILNQVGEKTSWKMTDGTVVESVEDASGKTNKTTTTAADTYQFVKDGDNTLAKRTSSTNDNLNITDGTNTYTKITTAAGNKQTVTDGTETASTNLTKSASNTLIENGTQSVRDHMAADTSYTVMNEKGNGSRRQQTASEILDRVTDGTNTSEVKQTASEVATSAKDISNTAKEKLSNSAPEIENSATKSITDKVGDNVERTMTTEQIQDKVGKTTVTTTDGLTKLTNEKGTHKTEMDYANVTKDLSVEGDATVDKKLTVKGDSDLQGNATVGKNLEVKGTSTLIGDVTMESNASVGKNLTVNGDTTMEGNASVGKDLTVKGDTTMEGSATVNKDLTVEGETNLKNTKVDGTLDVTGMSTLKGGLAVTGGTTTDTLHVKGDGYVGGDLKVDGNIETHDAELSADSRQVVTGRQLYQTNERVDRLDNRIKKVGANAAALAALRPGDFNPDDKFSIAAGFGSYRNASAAALGLFYRPNENVLLSLGTSFGDGENMVNAGVSVKFGRGKSMAERRKEMADEVSSMRDEMRSQDERIAELEEMLKKQSELIEKLSKES